MYQIFWVIILTLLCSCSSVFYHPVKDHYIQPQQINAPLEVITLQTTDHVQLHGWYFPTQKTKKAKGLILHFHGNAQNLSSHFLYLWRSLNFGYDYFIFDYRGYGKSEGSPSPDGLINDGQAALIWANQKAKDLKVPLIVYAQSLGGAVALKSLEELGERVTPDALIIDSSFASYRSAAKNIMASVWWAWPLQWLAWLIVDNSQAPQKGLEKITAKHFLVIHGTEDQVISPKLGERIYEALPEPKEFWSIPDGQHIDFLHREKYRYEPKFYAWLEKVLQN